MSERVIRPARRLRGTIAVPGDKSISHRAAMLNALAEGEAAVHNFLPGEDCLSTLRVLRALGVEATLDEGGDTPVLRIRGRGLRGLREAADVLDCGNSGTTMRLMSGVLAGQYFLSVLTGDASLRSRPMARVLEPLHRMGAQVGSREGGLAPLVIRGGHLRGIRYRLPVASAQVKSCVLLAGLFAEGETVVEEPEATRDHTERMLDAMGARIGREGPAVRLTPGQPLQPLSMRVPNDLSAAAFWMVAAAVHPDAELRLTGVGINPTRTGIIDALRAMGADLATEEERVVGGEPVADIVVRSSRLQGTTVEGEMVARLIDEAPVLAVAAAFAHGATEIRDARDLRVKESDRIATTASQLRALGAAVTEHDDGMTIDGGDGLRGGDVESYGDHRLAMALAIAGLAGSGDVRLRGAEAVAVSYPGFWADLEKLTE
ncbi:MAG TPA: 3-phosphoshikimate 1-carboxyvinyltransferase [Dehalococcoidia bacterium]|nr:3-phosphoshikimate 1-carboxyvinyltransferase [Dehalococcoidia bacterium]